MKIDWNEAPEGFPLWLEGTNEDHRKHSGWYRERGLVYEGAHGGQWRSCREGQFFTVHRKPELLEWTGEGLPPVGTVCEFDIDQGDWRPCEVIAHKDDYAICWIHCNKIFATGGAAVRPIRTPEQIAAEARLTAIDEMAAVYKSNYEGHVKDGCQALYDAGYRKQVKP